MRVLPLFIAVALSASLAACSGGPATSGDGNSGGGTDGGTSDGGGGTDSTGLPDPCALVTRADVETAAGGPMVGEGEEPEGPPLVHYAFGEGRQCVWGPVNGVVSPTFVTVYTYSADGWEQYKANQASFSSYHDITGLGDEALSPGTGGIGVHESDIVLDIQVGYEVAQDPAGEPRLITLAETALGNL